MSKSIVFYGYYGAGNLGDELLLSSLLQWARRNALEPVVISYDVAYSQRIHDVHAIDVEDMPAIVRAVAESQACVLGGGGIFQTHHPFSYSGLFEFGFGDIAAYARPAVLAQQLGVPSVLIGQGVGPLIHEAARDIVRGVFNAAQAVTVRDEASLNLLKAVGVEREVLMAPDLVWTLPLPNLPNTQASKKGRTRIALVIRPWFKSPGFEERMIAGILADLDPLRHALVWIPFQNHSIPYRSTSDTGFVQQCMDKFGPEWEQEIVQDEQPERVIQALAACDAVVAMRLHAQILAFKLGKPTLSVEYDAKMTELSGQVQQDAALRIRPENDMHAWRRAIKRLCDIQSPLGFQFEKVEKLKAEATQHFLLLDAFITDSSKGRLTKPRIRLQDINWFEYWLIWISKQHEARAKAERSELNKSIQLFSEALQLRESQIMTIKEGLAERDGQIVSLIQAVAERDGQIVSLNQAVVERDEQIASLNQAVAERDGQIINLNADLHMIKQSTSWRVTSPIRVAKKLVIEPRRMTYWMLRSLFWQLPASLRQGLHGPRHAFVRFARGLPLSQAQKVQTPSFTDISWREFNKYVLSRRAEYKGVFVQELVIDWNVPLYQRPQHISAALGRLGYLVIYRTDNWAGDNVNGFREVSKNVWITNRGEIEEIQGVVRSLYSTAYANTPGLIMKNGKRGALVYEYIDHIDPEISGDHENIKRLLDLKNFAFSGGADVIVASAKKLYDEAVDAVGEDKVILVQNGVDTAHYRDANHLNTLLPSLLVEFKKNCKAVVGYFGALAPWLWYDCIHELANVRPEYGFVFIGPDYYGGSSMLPKLGNVLYLGTVDYRILPAYAQLFDVCFIPFKPGDIAKTTSPLKLFEYFALEKPVVVTSDMDECTVYPDVFRGGSATEISKAIDLAMRVKDSASLKVRLRELANQNDWDKRALAYEVIFKKMIRSNQA